MRSNFLALVTTSFVSCSATFALAGDRPSVPLCCQRTNVIYAAYYHSHTANYFSGARNYWSGERRNITHHNMERYYAHRPYGRY
jgi:hypothetical protein